jgi:hypothetical protein
MESQYADAQTMVLNCKNSFKEPVCHNIASIPGVNPIKKQASHQPGRINSMNAIILDLELLSFPDILLTSQNLMIVSVNLKSFWKSR